MKRLLALALLLPTLAWADYDSVISGDSPTPWIWFHLDETSGTTAVNSGSSGSNDSSYTGGYTLNQTGIPGNSARPAVSFNGSTAAVSGGTNHANTVISTVTNRGTSFEVWAKPTSCATGTAQVMIGKGSGIDYEYRMFQRPSASDWSMLVYDGALCLGANYGQATGGTCTAGAWHHVVATMHTGGTAALDSLKLYVNGSNVATVSSFSGTFCSSGNVAMDVGRLTDSTFYFGGVLDEPIMYRDTNGANTGNELTATQVLNHYNAGVSAGAKAGMPFTVKAPQLPRFRDDGYFEKFVSRGYATGLWAATTLRPRTFGAWLPFSVVPNGRGM